LTHVTDRLILARLGAKTAFILFMAKTREIFVCEQCGNESLQWQGICPACRAGDSLKRISIARTRNERKPLAAPSTAPRRLSEVIESDEPRIATGLGELDRVLGGGLVLGSVTLLGGDPGIGKSTLLLQAGDALSRATPTLYVSGEESLRQVSLRARRLGVAGDALQLLAETSIETIIEHAESSGARVLVIDSIQTMHSAALDSSPGTATQVRETAAALVRFAKSSGVSVLIIGHVTKEGLIAGPRILEHMVDTVLYFESDAGSRFRMIRAVKNRFGAANEVGVFAMTEQGLKEVKNPSAIFLSHHAQPIAGSAVMVAREGSRPMLIEVQALTDDAQGMNPRRVAVGLESNRLALLLAVLHRHGGVARCVRQCRRRRAHFRNGCGLAGDSRDGLECARRAACWTAGVFRRGRIGRRDSAGALWRGTTARGCQARLRTCDRAGRERAAPTHCRHRGDRRRALERSATQRLWSVAPSALH
jgi:DNA repair protein RadA/Sms